MIDWYRTGIGAAVLIGYVVFCMAMAHLRAGGLDRAEAIFLGGMTLLLISLVGILVLAYTGFR